MTLDFAGPIRNGGIGTAFASLADALLAAGHEVTLLYPAAFSETAPLAEWVARLRRRGLRMETLDAAEAEPRLSLLAAHWLAERDFDVVHYHEWRGIGFFAAQLRRSGLGLRRTALVCQLHSPTEWHRRHSDDFLPGTGALEVAHMERRSAELADLVVSPSAYLLGWVRAEGWVLPRAEVIPNLLPGAFPRRPGTPRAVTEPVFFGRLEERKGLALFCEAVTRLVRAGTPPARVAFLGKVGEAGGTDGLSFIARAAAGWPFPWEVRNELDVEGARAFLAAPGRLAVIASSSENSPYTVLECLGAGTPFLAADVGGIAELVHPEDRAAVLFPRGAAALAEALAARLAHGAPALRPATPFAAAEARWSALQAEAAALAARPPATAAGTPLVTVVLPTYDRPFPLAEALRSLEAQDWPALEVVVVDDASPSPAARAFLAALEPRLAARGWRLLRQPANAYLGAARNAGIAAARGEFVAFLDDDNLAYPHFVSSLVRAALHSGAAVVTCQLHEFSGETRGPEDHPALPNGWIPLGGPAELGLTDNRLGDAGFLIRREALERLGGFTTDRAAFEDWELLLRAALAGLDILCLPLALYHYRVAPDGMLRGMGRHQAFRAHARIARAWAAAPDGPMLRRALAAAAEQLVAPRYPAAPGHLGWANAAPAFADAARRLRAAGSPAAPLLMAQAARLAPGDPALAALAAEFGA
ncbi:glycosyltransferase [Roseococcus sp. DSY-14]|uniref:glycosyltransferase n=1 Tax=Roseococcus sp. DSY-14 TaxID=3369650 RepID=UPI00387AA54F